MDVKNQKFSNFNEIVKKLLNSIPNASKILNDKRISDFKASREKFTNDVVEFYFNNNFVEYSHDIDSNLFREILFFNKMLNNFKNDLLAIDINHDDGPSQHSLKALLPKWEIIVEKRIFINDSLIEFEKFIENDFNH